MKTTAPKKIVKQLLLPVVRHDITAWHALRGLWKDKKIDGLKYQRKIRNEWK